MKNVFFYRLSFNAKLHKDTKNYPDGAPVNIVVTDEPVEISETEIFGEVLIHSNKRTLTYAMIPVTLQGGKPLRSKTDAFKRMQKKAGYNAKLDTYTTLGDSMPGWEMNPLKPVLNTETKQPNGMFWCDPA